MNIQEVKQVLPVLMKHKIVPFLWGYQGVGKTQTVKQIAQENGLQFIHLHLATQEVGDLVGLLVHSSDGTVKHARPEWFPTEGKGILFLDEMNRAHPDVLQAMFSLITEGTIHTHKLPAGWAIVAAGNYQNASFNVADTSDEAWISRFCHLDFNPSTEEFIVHVESKNMDSVAAFIRTNPEMLEVKKNDKPIFDLVTPDRRSMESMIGRLEEEASIDNVRYELYSGIIGKTAAASFITFKTKKYNRLSGKSILKKYKELKNEVLSISSNKKEVRLDLLNSAAQEILVFVEKKTLDDSEIDNLKEFLLDVPLELGLKIVNSITGSRWTQKNKIVNNPEFVEIFKARKLASK